MNIELSEGKETVVKLAWEVRVGGCRCLLGQWRLWRSPRTAYPDGMNLSLFHSILLFYQLLYGRLGDVMTLFFHVVGRKGVSRSGTRWRRLSRLVGRGGSPSNRYARWQTLQYDAQLNSIGLRPHGSRVITCINRSAGQRVLVATVWESASGF